MLNNINDLYASAKNIKPQKLVVVAAHDEVVIDSVNDALNMGIISPILIGNEKEIQRIIANKNYHLNQYNIIDCDDLEKASYIALDLIKSQKADILMKGLIDTKILLKAVVNKELGIKKQKLLSHVALFSYPDFDRVLFVSDSAMIINPSVEDRVYIIENAVMLAKTLGYNLPKVGLVSAVEKLNLKMSSTVDAVELVKLYHQGIIKDCIVDGPFAIDNLVSKESVKHKNITSEVAGAADILIFPSIESGNVFYKTSVFLAKAESAGIVIGATNPIVLTSRADSSKSKLNSIVLAMVYNHEKSKFSY